MCLLADATWINQSFDQVEAKMISYSKTLRTTALLCTILTAGLAIGQDGVVRMSDRAVKPSSDVGVVQMLARQSGPVIQQASHLQGGCNNGHGCNGGSCYAVTDCNAVFSSCDSSGMPACWCQHCNCAPCQCRDHFGNSCRSGRNGNNGCDEGATLFAGSVDSGTGSACRDFYHGQAMSFRNKNARLADKLFGWMIPSGCCGQGCPPVGKYHMTYADQPDYVNPNDTQVYAAQGYGMPITVPLAPNVNHTYNYSAGIPSSRITTIGNYNPQTAPQRLPHQTW